MNASKVNVPQIKATTDYEQFKVMGGNRNIDNNHVEKLKGAMLENPEWFATKPAVVNDQGFVIDGQHRLQAARQLGIPFYYVVGSKMNLMAARAMNIRQKQWTLLDYVRSYADAGNRSYQFILEMVQRYPALSPGGIVAILQGGTNDSQRSGELKAGLLFVEDERAAEAMVETFNNITKITRHHLPNTFVGIYMGLIDRNDFDENRFMRNLEAKPELFRVSNIAKEVYRTIEDVYNYNYSTANQLRLY